ncbi:hypothetical protein IWX48DRAFT_594839 [Phyllosticta citricarpa]
MATKQSLLAKCRTLAERARRAWNAATDGRHGVVRSAAEPTSISLVRLFSSSTLRQIIERVSHLDFSAPVAARWIYASWSLLLVLVHLHAAASSPHDYINTALGDLTAARLVCGRDPRKETTSGPGLLNHQVPDLGRGQALHPEENGATGISGRPPGPNYAQPSLKPTRRFSKPLVHARSRDPPSWDSLFGQVRACLHRFCWLCCGAMDQARPPPVVKQQPYSAPWQSLDRPRV